MSGEYRSGFVGIVGRPNVGKSTILNHFLGKKISIVSQHPQTTRQKILGVLTLDNAQIAFIDTPGIQEPKDKLGRYMLEIAKAVFDEADILLVVIDGRRGITAEDELIFTSIKNTLGNGRPNKYCRHVLLAINKTDLVKKPRLLQIIDSCAKTEIFSEYVPISALTGDQMETLLSCIIRYLPIGPPWYEAQQHTNQTTAQLISELIREKILLAVRQEVPHAVAVRLDQLDENKRVIAIQATIFVERQGQKAILIGRNGLMLKRIGTVARQELERLLGHKVYLGLWVKVESDWRSDERVLQELGYTCGGSGESHT